MKERSYLDLFLVCWPWKFQFVSCLVLLNLPFQIMELTDHDPKASPCSVLASGTFSITDHAR